MTDPTLVRALRDAARVPGAPAPYDTVHLSVRYPALPASTTMQRMSGMLEADASRGPMPVVVVVPGVNVAADSYRWLAVDLVEAGFVVVSYDWVGELFPGQYGLTPGVDISVATPEAYGTAPTTPALGAVLDRLAHLNDRGTLAGLLDLERVGLFGHSAGGTVALQSASPEWFPQVGAVATYGSHLMASEQLGFAPNTLLDSPVTAPVLLVSGELDGVVRASAVRYGLDPDTPGHDPVSRTWATSLGKSAQAWQVIVRGAGHMLPMDPDDPTSARGFLEEPLADDQSHLRRVLGQLVVDFFTASLNHAPELLESLERNLSHTPHEFAEFRRH